MHALTDSLFPRIMKQAFVLEFFRCRSHDKSTLGWRRGIRGCLCSPLWGLCWGAVETLRSSARRRGTQPELIENRGAQENTGPPKQNTFYGNGSIYLRGSQRTAAQRLFNGKQGNCGARQRISMRNVQPKQKYPTSSEWGGKINSSSR